MKKLTLLVALLLSAGVGFSQQADFAQLFQETEREVNEERLIQRMQIEETKETLLPQVKRIYKKLSPHQQALADTAFLKIAQAQDEISRKPYPRKNTRLDLAYFIESFKDLYEFHLSFNPKSPLSLVISGALYNVKFETQDGMVFQLNSFLQDYAQSFENLDQLTQGKLAVWSGQMTLDELALDL